MVLGNGQYHLIAPDLFERKAAVASFESYETQLDFTVKDVFHYACGVADPEYRLHLGILSDKSAELLRQEEKAQIQALMVEGYREMAEENRHMAEEAFPLAAETLRQNTQWKE